MVVLAVALLSAADLATTLAGVRLGLFDERNPLLDWALAEGVLCFAILKGSLTALWAAVSLRRPCGWLGRINVGVIGVYGAVVVRSTGHLLATLE